VAATEMPGPLHSLRHPILSDSAARAFYAGGHAALPRMASEAASQAGAKGSLLVKEMAGKQPSEDLLEELARHTCAMARPSECEVVMARWTASHPDSPRLARATLEIRASDFTGAVTNTPLPAATIASLAELYRGHALINSESPGPVRNAVLTSNLYAQDFHYAFPFDRAAVRRAWSACASDPRTVVACTQARNVAERKLGPIYTASAGHDAAPPTAAVRSEAAQQP
jgi:hypothetical protein